MCAFANDLRNHGRPGYLFVGVTADGKAAGAAITDQLLQNHFRSLLPLSLEARKPVFDLKAADGAIGSHAATAKDAYARFEALAREVARRAGMALP